LNRFAYVENSPVAFSDHLGFLPIGGGLKGGVAKAYAKHAVKKGGIAAAISKANGPKLPRHSMGTSGGERPGTLSRGGGGPGGAIVPMSRSNVYTSATHDDDPCASCLPIKSRFSGQSDGALDLWGTLLFFGAIIGIAALAVCVVATVGICAAASAAIATASVKVGAKVGVNAAIREISKRYILSFNNHKWSHIIREGHHWDRLAKTRAEVADLMARARAYGTARPDPRGHVDYHWFYKGEEIVVRVGPGGQIGNGWIVK
ncbi:hypothetical protein ACTJKK_16550, partial [Microbacterium sp. 22179]|uniref:hypothetical protein n=1 Tax=Microbacterium sp. 22179 TaxID=3453886 RepID=UPI003F840960